MPDEISWNDRYRRGEIPWDTGRPSPELTRVVAAQPIPPGRAIEFGCGTGTNAVWLAQQGFDVTGVDVSPLAIAQAEKRAVAAGVRVRFLAADLFAPPDLGGPYDLFFDRGCYHAVRRQSAEGYLNTVDQVLRPGALGLVLAGNAKERHEPGPPVVSEDELRTELGSRFEILELREFRFEAAETTPGFKPLGWSCLVRKSLR